MAVVPHNRRWRKVVGVEYESWWGLLAPTGTAAPVLGRLHSELTKVVRDKDYIETRLGKLGLEPFESPSPADAAALVRTYYAKLAPVVEKASIKPQ